jgi:hypothetical protein
MTDDTEIKFTRDDLIVLAVVFSIALLLLAFCYKAGNSSGYRDALEGERWFCVPNKSDVEIKAPKKVYEPKP